MKKCMILLVCMLMLTGCGAVETMETLGNVIHNGGTQAPVQQVVLEVPAEASVTVSGGETGLTMYECDGYTLYLQTFSSGDLQGTIRTLSGFAPEDLTVMTTACNDHQRYDWVWTAAAEEGDLVCRGTVLDDGNYHYTLCVMAQAEVAGELSEEWNGLFRSFCLEN